MVRDSVFLGGVARETRISLVRETLPRILSVLAGPRCLGGKHFRLWIVLSHSKYTAGYF